MKAFQWSVGWKRAIVRVPWRGSVPARLAWGDLIVKNQFEKVPKALKGPSLLRHHGTPTMERLQLPEMAIGPRRRCHDFAATALAPTGMLILADLARMLRIFLSQRGCVFLRMHARIAGVSGFHGSEPEQGARREIIYIGPADCNHCNCNHKLSQNLTKYCGSLGSVLSLRPITPVIRGGGGCHSHGEGGGQQGGINGV